MAALGSAANLTRLSLPDGIVMMFPPDERVGYFVKDRVGTLGLGYPETILARQADHLRVVAARSGPRRRVVILEAPANETVPGHQMLRLGCNRFEDLS